MPDRADSQDEVGFWDVGGEPEPLVVWGVSIFLIVMLALLVVSSTLR